METVGNILGGAGACQARSRRGLVVVIVLLVLGSAGWSESPPTEYAMKAAFLYNFARFVEWPNSTDSLQVCVLGRDPFGRVLDDTLQGKMVHDRRLLVLRLSRLEGAVNCQLLFVSPSENERLPAILAELKGRQVLTVGESPDFARLGGMIGFHLENKRVRFQINLRAVEDAGLTMSSQLLKLAKPVEG